jgi:hypothetical protein
MFTPSDLPMQALPPAVRRNRRAVHGPGGQRQQHQPSALVSNRKAVPSIGAFSRTMSAPRESRHINPEPPPMPLLDWRLARPMLLRNAGSIRELPRGQSIQWQ